MAQKAKLFHDSATYTEILKASTPQECNDLGREEFPSDYRKWDAATAEITPVDRWPGQNLLGKILMELRNEFGGSQQD